MYADNKIKWLANELNCSYSLAQDLLILAGGDEEIILDASKTAHGIESFKVRVISSRLDKLERSLLWKIGL